MKRFYKLFACWVSVFLLVFSSGMQSHASFESLLISTDSNTLMTLNLTDEDYSISLMSSLGTVVNTIQSSELEVYAQVVSTSGSSFYRHSTATLGSNGRYSFRLDANSGEYIKSFFVRLFPDDLPSSGAYQFSFDLASDFAYEVDYMVLDSYKDHVNATTQYRALTPPSQFYSGDIYISPYDLQLTNVNIFDIKAVLTNSSGVSNLGGSFAIRFQTIQSGSYPSTAGSDTSASDYQSDVSSSLSDLSSSVESVEEEISLVTQAIQTLQGAMEPHYDNVLTQLHHITEQLHAFYDQVYNNIHLPELDMLTQIRTAIENIDLQIEVDISEVKTAINNMSTAVQNKLQSTTDQITGGYDNSQQTQQNQQLQDSINAYDKVEEDIFEDVDGFMQEFEYPSFDSMNGSVIKALAFIGGFLQSIFLSMGDFGVIITFSLTMIFVMIIVGYHRIRS